MSDLSNVLLITDLDGTLLPDNKILSQKDKEAIKRFRADGGKFTVATGRTIQSAMKYFEELEVDLPVILYNGSLIYDILTKKVMYTDFLPECAAEIGKELFEFMENPGGEVLRLDNIYVVCNNDYEKEHTNICQVEPVYTTLDMVPKGEWFKILFATEPALINKNQEFEMLPKGSSKGSALREYIKLMEIDNMKVIAAGDYHNDIEMLQAADIGAATANAQQALKDVADIVLEHTSNDCAIAELIDMIYEGSI